MLCQAAAVKSGDKAQASATLPQFLIHDFLRIVEAAAALHFAAKPGISPLSRRRARVSGVADVAFVDPVAKAHDHPLDITIMRTIRKT
jgi:hypothetical protein